MIIHRGGGVNDRKRKVQGTIVLNFRLKASPQWDIITQVAIYLRENDFSELLLFDQFMVFPK